MGRDPGLRSLLERLELQGIRLGLDRMAELLGTLGSPERAVPTVLVGGTNGKGSTCALLERCLRAGGVRVGLYTSPHLESPPERIRVDGQLLSAEALGTLLDEVCAAARTVPTYFEAFTAAAFLAFARARLDLAVLEVGMGGRLDATNLCDPCLSLVTSIDFDHQEYLGTSLGAIAREKAGILRRGRPALLLAGGEEPTSALLSAAATLGAPARDLAPYLTSVEISETGWESQRIRLSTPRGQRDLRLGLAGRHQAANLLLAVAGLEELGDAGWPISEAAIAAGVAGCRWPGRLESIHLPPRRRVLLDAAHNPGGVASLARFLGERGEPFTLLFAALRDKAIEQMLPPLAELAEEIVLTSAASPRSASPDELAARLPGRSRVTCEADRQRALDRALAGSRALVVVCGSIYLVGEMRSALRARFGVPAPPGSEE